MSKTWHILLGLVLGCGALPAQEPGKNLPTALPASRYAALERTSMFAPPAPVASTEAKASFAADLFVAGLAQFGGKDFVMIINRRTREKFSLLTGEKGPDGVELAGVRWAEDPAQSAVTVKRGADSSVLEFDEAAFQKPAVQPAANTPQTGPGSFRPTPSMPVMPYQQPSATGAAPATIGRRLRIPSPQ